MLPSAIDTESVSSFYGEKKDHISVIDSKLASYPEEQTLTGKVFVLKWCISLGLFGFFFNRSLQHSVRLCILGDEECGRIGGSLLCASIIVPFISIK